MRKVVRGLREAVAHARGEPSKVIVHAPKRVDVKAIRKRTGLSQDAFAKRFGFTPDSIQNWESNRRDPTGAARLLLNVIDREPEAVERALHKGK